MKETIRIIGNKVDCFRGYEELYNYILPDVSSLIENSYVTVNNVHTMVEGYRDYSYQQIINNGYLSIPDGKPLEIVGKLKGNRKISRLFGPTVMEKFIDWGRKNDISHFFLGSSETTLKKLKEIIDLKYPGAKVAGMIAPPFKPLNEWDNEAFIQEINKNRPDFIWIGLGAPKQERWMHEHCKKLNHGIMFGIGAGFDYLAGNTRHAPGWMKSTSLEWLFRLIQEPRRLWKRYLKTIPLFMIIAPLDLMGIHFRKGKN